MPLPISNVDFEMHPRCRPPIESVPIAAVATSAQRRMWLMEQLAPGTGAFNESLALRLKGPLDTVRIANGVRPPAAAPRSAPDRIRRSRR